MTKECRNLYMQYSQVRYNLPFVFERSLAQVDPNPERPKLSYFEKKERYFNFIRGQNRPMRQIMHMHMRQINRPMRIT